MSPASMTDDGDFDGAVAAHDALLAALGVEIWVGNEPTFTDRFSNGPEWVNGALGGDKLERARRLLTRIARERPGSVILRTIGRQYAGESWPRWSLGLYARRDGTALWHGPPDPLLEDAGGPTDLVAFHALLEASLATRGFRCAAFRCDDDRRLVLARDRSVALPDPASDVRLRRPSVHVAPIPAEGVRDDLAQDGLFLLVVSSQQEGAATVACIDLPAFDSPEVFGDVLAGISEAARAAALPSLILRGFGPPVDASVCWATVTPDPAVVEVNMAPHPSVLAFLADNRQVYCAASSAGLAPYRLHYNGTVTDSGGGGQITFGGSSPERSPFFLYPRLLPRLVRYALLHPALSYLFAHDFIGASGQSVRPDEHGRDALDELRLALALLDREPSPTPALLWMSLAPSLTDPMGNSHRAEINVEKLWNPSQPGRGQLGLVEFRAFRMQHTPERAAALAAMLRAIFAMLVRRRCEDDVVDWGDALHDRFALPYFLEADLSGVLDDLAEAGLALPPPICKELMVDACGPWATIDFGYFALTIRRAVDFWSLLGDASRQQGSSRLVDSSSARIELAVRPRPGAARDALDALRLRVEGVELPLRSERDARGPLRLFGVRYRAFLPTPGLHPTLKAQTPLHLHLIEAGKREALEVVLHEWRPDGGSYDGVPADVADATIRRAARCTTRHMPVQEVPRACTAPAAAMSRYSLDLRYVPSAPLDDAARESHSGRCRRAPHRWPASEDPGAGARSATGGAHRRAMRARQ